MTTDAIFAARRVPSGESQSLHPRKPHPPASVISIHKRVRKPGAVVGWCGENWPRGVTLPFSVPSAFPELP